MGIAFNVIIINMIWQTIDSIIVINPVRNFPSFFINDFDEKTNGIMICILSTKGKS